METFGSSLSEADRMVPGRAPLSHYSLTTSIKFTYDTFYTLSLTTPNLQPWRHAPSDSDTSSVGDKCGSTSRATPASCHFNCHFRLIKPKATRAI